MFKIITFVALLFATTMQAQTQNENLLLGSGIEQKQILATGQNWQTNYNAFQATENLLRAIRIQKSELTITAVFGSWCEDSETWLPQLLKLLYATQFPANQTQLIGVDRSKKIDLPNFADLKIEFLPTFIFYRNGKEIGRFVESPKTTFETDLLNILKID